MSVESFTKERPATDSAWSILLAASAMADAVELQGQHVGFGLDFPDGHARLHPLPIDSPDAVIAWHPESAWQSCLAPDDPRSAMLDLYLPVCGTKAHPVTVGHLGQRHPPRRGV